MPNEGVQIDAYYEVADVAETLGIKTASVRQATWRGQLPPDKRMRDGKPLWEKSRIDQLAANRHQQ